MSLKPFSRDLSRPVHVPLGKSGKFVILDEGDYLLLRRHSMRLTAGGYVVIRRQVNGRDSNYLISRLLTGCPADKRVDHINGDKLDNRRCNLRVCTNRENAAHRTVMNSNNTTGAAGVNRRKDRWRATYGMNGKKFHVGTYDTMEEAIAARTAALAKAVGEFLPTDGGLRERSRG